MRVVDLNSCSIVDDGWMDRRRMEVIEEELLLEQ